MVKSGVKGGVKAGFIVFFMLLFCAFSVSAINYTNVITKPVLVYTGLNTPNDISIMFYGETSGVNASFIGRNTSNYNLTEKLKIWSSGTSASYTSDYERDGLIAFNSTDSVLLLYDNPTTSLKMMLCKVNGVCGASTPLYSSTNSVYNPNGIPLNNTHFLISYYVVALSDVIFSIVAVDGSSVINFTADNSAGTAGFGVNINRYNNSLFVISYTDRNSNIDSFRMYYYNGTAYTGQITILDNSLGGGHTFSSIVLDDYKIIHASNQGSKNMTISAHTLSGTTALNVYNKTYFNLTSSEDTIFKLHRLNSTNFMIYFYNTYTGYTQYMLFSSSTLNNITGQTNLFKGKWSSDIIPKSYDYRNISLCKTNTLIVSWANGTTSQNRLLNTDMTEWEGNCDIPLPPTNINLTGNPVCIIQNSTYTFNWTASTGTGVNYNQTINLTQVAFNSNTQYTYTASSVGNFFFSVLPIDSYSQTATRQDTPNYIVTFPEWNCASYGICNANNISNCTAVSNDTSCLNMAFAGNLSVFNAYCQYNVTIPPITNTTAVSFDLTQTNNILLLGILIFFWLGLGVVAFMFKSFAFGSFMWIVGLVLGFMCISTSFVLGAGFVLISTLIFMGAVQKFH